MTQRTLPPMPAPDPERWDADACRAGWELATRLRPLTPEDITKAAVLLRGYTPAEREPAA